MSRTRAANQAVSPGPELLAHFDAHGVFKLTDPQLIAVVAGAGTPRGPLDLGCVDLNGSCSNSDCVNGECARDGNCPPLPRDLGCL